MIKKLVRVIFTIGAVLFSPLALVLLLPIYLHRVLATKLAKLFRPEFGKILTTLSTNFSNDRLYTHSECFSIVIHTIKGHLPVSNLQNLFVTRALDSWLPDGSLRYPELKQYPYKWMGFYFWKSESDFNIQEHIYQLPQKHDEHLTRQDIRKIVQDLHAKPFAVDKSPWEGLLAYSNHPVEGKQSFFLMKMHHGMADGFSIMKLLVDQLSQNDTSSNAKPKYYQRSLLENIIYWSAFPIRAIYEFSSTAMDVLLEKSPWHAPRKNRTYSVVGMGKPIAISRVKAVKDKFGVTFTSVVQGLCSLTMKSYMTTQKIPIPEKTICILPFPMSGHPQKLRNFMTQVVTDLPLQLHPEETLLKAHESYENIKKSTAPIFNFLMGHVLGGLYASLCSALISPIIPSILLTNFPATFEDYVIFDGFPCVEASMCCGLLNLPGLGFYILSYVDTLTIVIVADNSLMSESQVQDFADFFETEFEMLEQLEPTDKTKEKKKQNLLLLV